MVCDWEVLNFKSFALIFNGFACFFKSFLLFFQVICKELGLDLMVVRI